MSKVSDEQVKSDYKKLLEKVKSGRAKIRTELAKNKQIAVGLKENAQDALYDLKSGKVFTDDEAAQNFKNTLSDTLKAVGMTGIFMLPGGSIGLIALRKMLKSKEAKALGIENLLTLTIEEAEKIEASKDVKNDEKIQE